MTIYYQDYPMSGKLSNKGVEITTKVELESVEIADDLKLIFDERFHFHKAASGLNDETFVIEIEEKQFSMLGRLNPETREVRIKSLPK